MLKKLIAIIILSAILVLLLPYVKDMDIANLPNPRDGASEEVAWSEAVALLEDCRVGMIVQLHSLRVDLTLKDSRKVHTTEPAIDEVFRVYERVQPTCGSIPIATE